jgi:hypothetical protein
MSNIDFRNQMAGRDYYTAADMIRTSGVMPPRAGHSY